MVVFSGVADILGIKAFDLYLKKDNGELVTYPNTTNEDGSYYKK